MIRWALAILMVLLVIAVLFYAVHHGQKVLDQGDEIINRLDKLERRYSRTADDIHSFVEAQNLPVVQPGNGRHAMGKRLA